MKISFLFLAGLLIMTVSGHAQTQPRIGWSEMPHASPLALRAEFKVLQIRTIVNLTEFQQRHLDVLLVQGSWIVDNQSCHPSGYQPALCIGDVLLFGLLDPKQQIQYVLNTSAPLSR